MVHTTSTLKAYKPAILFICFLFLFLGFSNTTQAQTKQIFKTSGSFIVPAGVTSFSVECVGGGGGGSSIKTNGAKGGGGGGGAYASSVITNPGTSYAYTVGAGGAANAKGENSTFGSNTVVAIGGNGGTDNAATAGSGGTGSTGTTTYPGGNGANGGGTNSGGGGGGAGSTGPGGNASGFSAGTGTTLYGGAGGTGVSGGQNGNNGNTYGGGGSGAVTNSGSNNTGGIGAAGCVVVTYLESISGNFAVTIGLSTTLSNSTSGGTWTSSNTAVATINSSTGVVTTVSVGSTNITYSVASGITGAYLTTTTALTVIPLPTITANGGGSFCAGSNVALTSSGTNISNYYWEGPAGYLSVSQNPVLSNVTPAMTGTYKVTGSTFSGMNLVTNGDFELGNTGFTSGYSVGTDLNPEGRYAVVANPNSVHTGFSTCANHSPSGTLQMVINGATVAGQNVWSQSVNVTQGKDYQFTYWVQSVVGSNPSRLQLYVNGVAAGPVYTALTPTCQWLQFAYNWNSGTNTVANLSLVNQNTIDGGNDFSLDDIMFQQAISTTSSVNVTVNPNLPVSVSIAASPSNIIYSGSSVTFTATPTNGGSSPSYQWKLNGSNIGGATSPTYTSATLINGNNVTCVLTSNATPCATGNPATSNTVAMTVNPSNTISLSSAVGTNAQTKCISTAITNITYNTTVATGAGFSGLPTGVTGGWAANVVTISGTPTVSGTFNYTVTLTGGSGTGTATGTITVNPNVSISSQSTGAQSQCLGGAFSAITVTATGGLTYQWYSNTSASTSGATSLGATNGAQTNSYTPQASAAGTQYYYCIVSSTCVSATSAFSGAFITYPIPAAPAVTGASICIGSTNTNTLSASGAVAGDKYKWYDAATAGTLLKTSTDNTDNTYTTAVLASTTNYWVSILNSGGCEGARVQVTATYPSISVDDQTAAGTNSWIGHVYDGINFDTYFGRNTELETFDENFGGNTTCFNITSNSIARSIYTETYSVRYRMNSTKRGLYVVDLGSDDGSRLTVDGTSVYSDWTNHAYASRPKVVMSLTGSSSLMYDFFENGGENRVLFQNLTQVLSNTLTANLTQSVCPNSTGSAISGDVFGALPTGITLSGTGYQWTYSTTPAGIRTNISGATGATYIPNTSIAPFNISGTYYIYRNAVLSSVNNVLPNPYVATNESNATILTVLPELVAGITVSPSLNPVCFGSSVTYTATPINGGTTPVYQWKVNGVNKGTNSTIYSYIPTYNDAVTCVMTSNASPCLIGSPVTSNVVSVMVIDPSIPVSVSIVPSSNPVCSGNSVTYTATPINAGTLPVYQWKVNGIAVGTNAITYSYAPANNDLITCVLTSNASPCAAGSPATSNTVTMTVNPSNTITLSSAAGTNTQIKCTNSLLTNITYNTTGATGAIVSGLPTGVSGSWAGNAVTISGTPTVSGTFNYTVTLTGGYSCTAMAVGSITVLQLPTNPTVTGATLCIGSTATLLASGAVAGDKYTWYDAATAGTLLKTSIDNTDNTYTTAVLASTTNYWVSILNSGGCEGTRVQVTATFPSVSTDDQTAAGANSWIGHVYDGTNTNFNLNPYFGHYTESETFDESFGGNTNCFSITSNSSTRSIYTDYFSVRYRMNSTRRGLYVADMGSDDGSRLTVDGALIHDNWTPQGFTSRPGVLMSLSGSSSLIYDFFENGSQNRVVFKSLTQVLSNTLATNTSQSICLGKTGSAISGDVYGALPTGISLSGTGYQWTYSTTPSGARTVITGATADAYAPNTLVAPFNTAGTYYIYRNAVLSSANNVSPVTYVATNESNAAMITVDVCTSYWIGTTDTDWNKSTNWSAGYVPTEFNDVEFATVANYGSVAANDLVLDIDRTIHGLINATTKRLVIPAAKGLTVTNTITTDGNPNRILIQSNSTDANGTLIYHNASTAPVSATVEMYSKASWNLSSTVVGGKYKWQYISIPIRTIKANPTFDGAYVRRWNEPTSKWIQLQNADNISPFIGHEIVQAAAKTYTFAGQLENGDFTTTLNTSVGTYAGQFIFGNPYTATIDIRGLVFGAQTNATVFLYNTGSSEDWASTGSGTPGSSPGQYTSIPFGPAGVGGLPFEIPSMQGFLILDTNTPGDHTFKIPYNAVASKNTKQQRVRSMSSKSSTDAVYTIVDVKGSRFSDRMWIFSEPTCTRGFDNGWDGEKIIGSALAPQIYASEPEGDYQVNSVDDIDETELGFIPGEDETYTLTFTQSNIESRYSGLYLFDLVESKTIDISQTGTVYSFTAAPGVAPVNRFKIITSPAISTEMPNSLVGNNAKLRIFSSRKTIFVHNFSDLKGDLLLYDISGRFIQKYTINPIGVTTIPLNLPVGSYIVKGLTGTEVQTENLLIR